MFPSVMVLSLCSLKSAIREKRVQQSRLTKVEIPCSTTADCGSCVPMQHTNGMPKKQKPANPKKAISAMPIPVPYNSSYRALFF